MQRLIIKNMFKYYFSSLRLHHRFCYTEGVNNSFLESIWNSWAFGDLDYAQKALQSYFSSQVSERFPVLSVVLLQQTNAAFCQGFVAFFFCETLFNHLSAITFHFLNCPLNIRIGLGSILHKLLSLQAHKKKKIPCRFELGGSEDAVSHTAECRVAQDPWFNTIKRFSYEGGCWQME